MDIVWTEINQIQKRMCRWICSTLFHLHKGQQQAELINVYINQNSGYLWASRNVVPVTVYTEMYKETVEVVGNVLYLDLSGGYRVYAHIKFI